MRPCRQCRSPIENNVAVCPQCNTAQDERAKPSGPVPPPVLRRRLFRRAPPASETNPTSPPRRRRGLFVLALMDDLANPANSGACGFLLLLVLLGAGVGGALAGARGVLAGIAGVVIALVLATVVMRLLSSSEG